MSAAHSAPRPTGLSVTSDTDDSVSLSWNSVTDAGAYKVEYRRSSSSSWLHAGYVYSGTTETVDGLDCNTSYYFRVRARGDGSPYSLTYGTPSSSVFETTDGCPLPTAPRPTGLRVNSDTDDSVSLSWNAVTDAAVYKVEYRRSGSISWLHASYVWSGTSKTVDGLDCDTGYYFRVRARGDGSPYSLTYGDASSSVSETTDGCPLPTAPRPTGLSVTSDTDDSVSLSWNAVTDAAVYKVEYRRSGSISWLHASYVWSGTSKTVDGLDCDTGYYFRVRARGDGSPYSYTYGDPSSSVSETTDGCPLPTAPRPTGLSVTSDTDDSVSLSWNAVTDAGAYKVEYRRSSASSWLHADYVYSGTTETVDGLDCNTSYDFRVRARGDGSPYSYTYGDASSSLSETTDACDTLDPPTGLSLSVETGDDDDLDLAYTRSGESTHYYQFELHRSSTQYGTYSLVGSPKNDSSSPADFDNQTKGKWYKARGRNCSTTSRTGCDDWSSWSAAILLPIDTATVPDQVSKPTVIAGDHSLGVSWAAPSNGGSPITSYQVQYKVTTASSWSTASSVTNTNKTITTLTNGASYHVQVRACNSVGCGDWSTSGTGTPEAPITITDLRSPLYERESDQFTVSALNLSSSLGYEVRLQARTNEGVEGNDIGFNSTCSETSKNLTVPPNSTSYSTTVTLHVCDSEGSGGTVTVQLRSGTETVHGTIKHYVEVRPITVEIEVDDLFPETFAPTEDSPAPPLEDQTMMTAVVDGPDGAAYTYQWQEMSTNWTNIVGATGAEKSVWSSTRGTRAYRVQVTHGGVTVTSEPSSLIWDATKIVIDMLDDMESRVTAAQDYTTAQTALLTCMNKGRAETSRFESFDDILASYTGANKARMDAGGACSSQATTMFDTYQRVSKEQLTALRTSNSEYDALLSTELGRSFMENVSAPQLVKRYASYLAPDSTAGAAGSSGAITEFNCVPAVAPTSLDAKMDVLNCLIFDTPHSFWETNSTALRDRIRDPVNWSQYSFLSYGPDDECTKSPDGPRYACRKHDVVFASLQKFEGIENGSELDQAWNPRNKYLADSKFRRDVEQYGCQDPSWNAPNNCLHLVSWSYGKHVLLGSCEVFCRS